MNPFEVTIRDEITLDQLCWDLTLSIGDLLLHNQDTKVVLGGSNDNDDTQGQGQGREVAFKNLRGDSLMPIGMVVKLPPVLQVRGKYYGSYFNVDDFKQRLNNLKRKDGKMFNFGANQGRKPVTRPIPKFSSPVDQLAAAIKDEAQRQTGAIRNASSVQDKTLANALDVGPLHQKQLNIVEDFANTPLNVIRQGDIMSEPPIAKKANILVPALEQSVPDTSEEVVSCGSSIQLKIDVMERRSAHKIKESWVVADSQKLTTLMENISCTTNLVPFFTTKNAFLFIGGTFYVDSRRQDDPEGEFTDISEVIRTWDPFGTGAVYGECPVKPMQDTTFADLRVKMGELCLFRHHGNCDHYFCFSEVSRLQPPPNHLRKLRSESQDQIVSAVDDVPQSSFPHRTYATTDRVMVCDLCTKNPATILVYHDRLTPRNPTVLCPSCHAVFHTDEHGRQVDEALVFQLPPGHHF